MVSQQSAIRDERRESRLDVLHRTRIVHQNGRERAVTVVNISSGGFMARGDGEWARGDRISIVLPIVGLLAAQVRWCLGGRIGCQFERAIDAGCFAGVLDAMPRHADRNRG